MSPPFRGAVALAGESSGAGRRDDRKTLVREPIGPVPRFDPGSLQDSVKTSRTRQLIDEEVATLHSAKGSFASAQPPRKPGANQQLSRNARSARVHARLATNLV